jgi:hypothetical protein
MQEAPIGFLFAKKASMILIRTGSTVIFSPAVANVERFFAAPKPPGIITAYAAAYIEVIDVKFSEVLDSSSRNSS